MKQIKLSQGKFAIVDDEDFEHVNQHKWYCHKGYGRRALGEKRQYLHNFILPPPDGLVVDHINHNTLDNRKFNLRHCTPTDNNRNRKILSHLKFKGIRKTGNKFIARIGDAGVHYLGCYATAEEAARAYDRAAIEMFGEFAHLNFPQEKK